MLNAICYTLKMYDLNDTIVAVSSPTSDKRVIVRITGPETFNVCRVGLAPPIDAQIPCGGASPTLLSGKLTIDELEVDAKLYLFRAPNSYTGDDVAEIHIYTNRAATEALIGDILSRHSRVRLAGPGEFTARAYLNGKIDLAQAEAVNEIIVSSNEYQLAAAERLLDGRLGQTAASLRDELMDCLSLIEAGLDFSDEGIEFISRPDAIRRLAGIRDRLEQLLAGSISCESLVDLPSVGIAGAPNAGKSSLLNTLLGRERSIVSSEHKTTRDVLTGLWTLPHCQCVLFDCAGLLVDTDNILDELAQEAAIEALRNSDVVIFCADMLKSDWSEDLAIRKLIEPTWHSLEAEEISGEGVSPLRIESVSLSTQDKDEPGPALSRPPEESVVQGMSSQPYSRAGRPRHVAPLLVPVATKYDLLDGETQPTRLAGVNEFFGEEFMPVSSQTGIGIELLRNTIDDKLTKETNVPRASMVAMTARHKTAVAEAIDNIATSIDELKMYNDEVAAIMLRTAHQAVCDLESAAGGSIPVDDQILEQIFSRFCIGK